MCEKIEKMLREQIMEEIQKLEDLETGSKEKSMAIEDVATLYKLMIETTKMELDFEEKSNRRMTEETQYQLDVSLKERQIEDEVEDRLRDDERKRDQLTEQVKERYFKFGMEVAGIMMPLIFYGVWMRKGFQFEETGTFGSITFKGLINRFKPTRK